MPRARLFALVLFLATGCGAIQRAGRPPGEPLPAPRRASAGTDDEPDADATYRQPRCPSVGGCWGRGLMGRAAEDVCTMDANGCRICSCSTR